MPEKKLLSWSKAQQNISQKEEQVDIREVNTGYPQGLKVDIAAKSVDIPISTNEPSTDISISTKVKNGYPQKEDIDIHKRDRHASNRIAFFARIAPDINKQIAMFLIEHRIEKQDFLERAAIHFMEFVDIQKSEKVDIKISLDERRKMIWVTSPIIINLYLSYLPDNQWKARDDREASKYNGVDIRLVELGILHALLRTEHKRIHSFKYFVEEIEENIAVPLDDETINILLKHRRVQYQKKKGNLPPH